MQRECGTDLSEDIDYFRYYYSIKVCKVCMTDDREIIMKVECLL